jgi:hypothetical protein
MGRPAMVRRTLRGRRVEARRAGITPRMVGFTSLPVGFSLWPESSMIGDGCAVAIVLSDYRDVCAGIPLEHIGGVAQMVRATDS